MPEKTQDLTWSEKLNRIQTELKAPKGQYNTFGKYKYRSAEDILEAVKPLLDKYGAIVLLSDSVNVVGTEKTIVKTTDKAGNTTETMTESLRTYISATAKFIDVENGETVVVTAEAREPQTKTGMDASQITGTASSYARKYALNGLFCIDDTKDVDTNEHRNETVARAAASTKKTADEYMALIDDCETEQGVNILFYEWSKLYQKGSPEYTKLSKKSFDRKAQITGA